MNKCKICQKLVDGFVLMQYFNRNKTHKWKWPKRGGKGESEIFLRCFIYRKSLSKKDYISMYKFPTEF